MLTGKVRYDLTVNTANIGLKGSPTRVAKTEAKSVKQPGTKIETGVDESVQYVIDKLKEKYLL